MDVNKQELEYLEKTLDLIDRQLAETMQSHADTIAELQEERRYMWEETNHHSSDLEKLGEALNSLSVIEARTARYSDLDKAVKRYTLMRQSPYFARIDYREDGMSDESIYIGRANLLDTKTLDSVVYDWRSPVASIFYRFPRGRVYYDAPYGRIEGELLGKRQYSIKNGQLEFFFDSDLNIQDEMLGEALAKNSSLKMKTIVETIQAQQDEIIRDDRNDVLVVQGVAGSGKTSVALHRVAYLMYQGMNEKLSANNIVIISPNDLFSTYISNVLPELGEDNVASVLFEDLCVKATSETVNPLPRNTLIERLIKTDETPLGKLLRDSVEFKSGRTFMTILDRLIDEFAHRLCPFSDVFYNGKCVATRQEQKEFLLHNTYNTPIAIRLLRLEERLIDQMRELRRERAKHLTTLASGDIGPDSETKRLVHTYAVHEANTLVEHIRSYTRVDYMALYRRLFTDKLLFARVSQGLKLPDNIDDIISLTIRELDSTKLSFEDATALCYLTTKMAGIDEYRDIRQVVIDEAQDYYPIHFAIFANVFTHSRFTILGDVNQTIEKEAKLSLYDEAIEILGRKRNIVLKLSKSYRSTIEIQNFASRLLAYNADTSTFERHGEVPKMIRCTDTNEMYRTIAKDAQAMRTDGLGSVAVICKSSKEAQIVARHLSGYIDCTLIDEHTENQVDGVLVVPVYMAKGLEFDGVIVYDASCDKYHSSYDKQLLYIACTRPLHRLHLYSENEFSKFLL